MLQKPATQYGHFYIDSGTQGDRYSGKAAEAKENKQFPFQFLRSVQQNN